MLRTIYKPTGTPITMSFTKVALCSLIGNEIILLWTKWTTTYMHYGAPVEAFISLALPFIIPFNVVIYLTYYHAKLTSN
jgi:membrane protein CcdC involved in cytochrome C biogenesis